MLERDYFLKIIEEFAVAIQRFLNKKKEQQTDEEIQDLYRQYVGDYDNVVGLPTGRLIKELSLL